MSESKLINDVIKKFGIEPKDVFLHESKKYKIIKRSGYLQIAKKINLQILISLEYTNGVDSAVVSASFGGVTVLGEASPRNCTFEYPVAVAQKRAEGRAILQYAELYEKGFITEDEIDFTFDEEKILKKVQAAKNVGKASIEATKAKLGISAAKK
jgi:hypothetical protein